MYRPRRMNIRAPAHKTKTNGENMTGFINLDHEIKELIIILIFSTSERKFKNAQRNRTLVMLW